MFSKLEILTGCFVLFVVINIFGHLLMGNLNVVIFFLALLFLIPFGVLIQLLYSSKKINFHHSFFEKIRNLFHKSSPMQQIHFLYGKCDRCGDEFVITTTNQNNDTQPIQTVKLNDQERHLCQRCAESILREFNKNLALESHHHQSQTHYSSDLIGSIFDQTRKKLY